MPLNNLHYYVFIVFIVIINCNIDYYEIQFFLLCILVNIQLKMKSAPYLQLTGAIPVPYMRCTTSCISIRMYDREYTPLGATAFYSNPSGCILVDYGFIAVGYHADNPS